MDPRFVRFQTSRNRSLLSLFFLFQLCLLFAGRLQLLGECGYCFGHPMVCSKRLCPDNLFWSSSLLLGLCCICFADVTFVFCYFPLSNKNWVTFFGLTIMLFCVLFPPYDLLQCAGDFDLVAFIFLASNFFGYVCGLSSLFSLAGSVVVSSIGFGGGVVAIV
jgi:hypothetical protein